MENEHKKSSKKKGKKKNGQGPSDAHDSGDQQLLAKTVEDFFDNQIEFTDSPSLSSLPVSESVSSARGVRLFSDSTSGISTYSEQEEMEQALHLEKQERRRDAQIRKRKESSSSSSEEENERLREATITVDQINQEVSTLKKLKKS